jgi:hypothetical protein
MLLVISLSDKTGSTTVMVPDFSFTIIPETAMFFVSADTLVAPTKNKDAITANSMRKLFNLSITLVLPTCLC